MERDCSDEHEEGEIIDDFEDISDYSIPSTSNSGKSVSHRGLLQDVSLSSISDNEPDALIYVDTHYARTRRVKRTRKTVHNRRKKRYKPSEHYKHKYVDSSSLSSGSDNEGLDAKTQKLLKDAVRIDKSHIHHNSLRTRLKAMLQSESIQSKSEDEDEETLRTLALLSNSKDDEGKSINNNLNDVGSADDKDEELIELRLAALKSAVLRKAPEIRKRKCKQQPQQISEKNKENNVNQENNIEENIDHIKNAQSSDNPKIIIDDIKVENDTLKNISIEEDIDIMRAKLLASMSKKITSNVSIEDTNTKIPKERNIDIKNVNPNNTQKYTYLKQQKKVKPLIINLNDSDSDTDIMIRKDQTNVKDINLVNSVSEFLRKQRAAVEAKTKAESKTSVKDNTLDKSVMRLLPKSQQKEYHLLKQKLLMARKKCFKKISQKSENNKNVIVKKCPKETTSKEDVNSKQQLESKPVGLQKALDDIQIKKNGRLQMKGKYKALAPLLQKVNQASIERKQCELEIKVLLESLQKARDKLAISHQNYSNLVMRLTNQKNAIDRRCNKTHNMRVVNNNVNVIKSTSTPVKCNTQESVCDISSIHNSQDNVKESDIITNNAQLEVKDDIIFPANNNDLPKCDNESNTLKQYVSPLDSKNRDTVEDPLITFCPFELFGVCKDPECKFNHCSKT